MGKRKERRLAAQSAAGRRVKLDLFAEPSGDLGASSTTDEVGGEGDSKIRAELPRSPTSSDPVRPRHSVSLNETPLIFTIYCGTKAFGDFNENIFVLGKGPVNPLLLLGQYSDDELDEERGDRLDHVTKENLSTILDDQVKEASGEEDADTEISVHQDVSELRAEEENMESLPAPVNAFLEENGIRENASANPEELLGETDVAEKISVPGTSDTQATEDSSSGWKMVLHEESNSYYYWNIVTGETSWVAPDVLIKGADLVPEQKAALETEEREDTSNLSVAVDDSTGLLPDNVSICDQNVFNDSVHEVEAQREVDLTYVLNQKGQCNDVDASDAERGSAPVCADHGASLPGDCGISRQSEDVLPGSANKECADCGTRRMTDYEQQQTAIDLSSRLVRHGEYLLGRLTSLKGYSGHDYQIVKLILEVEIRLHDMRSLISSGTSLLPFWLHSESQLKKLEAAIDDEVLKFCESATINENNVAQKSDEIIHDNIKVNAAERKAVCSSPADADAFGRASLSTELEKHSSNHLSVDSASVPSEGYLYSFSDSNARGIAVPCGTGMPAYPKNELQTEDDVDMDVEMEVEDAVDATNIVNGDASRGQYDLPEHPMLPHPPSQHDSPLLEEGQIPPLPDDEWIPPPPPDDEPIPPPPPDEPPESVPPPPSEYQTVEQFSYADHYNLTYPGSGFEYCGQTHTEIPNSGYYVDANGCQTAAAHPQVYYAPVPTTYSAAAPVILNSVEHATYYTFQDGSLSTASTVTGVETHGVQSTPGYLFLGTEQNGAVEAHKEVGFTPVPTIDAGASAVGKEIENVSQEAPLIPTSIQSPATNSITQVPVVSNPAISSVIASAEHKPKVPSKATRIKKKTVALGSSLRSNKKVSVLVDKWKAAKEELHEDEEEEPEDPYERLEKKRQREIEEWRAQQIATGEAKDNANFQPLGGDWRERVQRKRAKTMSEAAKTSSNAIDDGNQQPDLNELSRDLPSGWQAYWDETSKQVYYGNSLTSETTWIRPTNIATS